MTNNQLQLPQRTLYDWAESEGWSELRYDEVDHVWRGFPHGELTEVNVPVNVLLEFIPQAAQVEFDAISVRLQVLQLATAKFLKIHGLTWETIDADAVEEFMSQYPGMLYRLAHARNEYDLACKYVAYGVAVQLGLVDSD